MKNLYCKKCESIIVLIAGDNLRTCECGECGGKYYNPEYAVVFPRDAVVFAIDNNTFGISKDLYYHYGEAYTRIPEDYRMYFFTGFFVNDHRGQVDFYNTLEEIESIPYFNDIKHLLEY